MIVVAYICAFISFVNSFLQIDTVTKTKSGHIAERKEMANDLISTVPIHGLLYIKLSAIFVILFKIVYLIMMAILVNNIVITVTAGILSVYAVHSVYSVRYKMVEDIVNIKPVNFKSGFYSDKIFLVLSMVFTVVSALLL